MSKRVICSFLLTYFDFRDALSEQNRPLNLSGTYCHKTGTRPSSCFKPRQPTIYDCSLVQIWFVKASKKYSAFILVIVLIPLGCAIFTNLKHSMSKRTFCANFELVKKLRVNPKDRYFCPFIFFVNYQKEPYRMIFFKLYSYLWSKAEIHSITLLLFQFYSSLSYCI